MSKHVGIENNTEKASNQFVKSKNYMTAQEIMQAWPKWILDKYVTRWEIDDRDLAGKILIQIFYEILLDVIANNATFVFPINGEYAEITLSEVCDEKFKKYYKEGLFQFVDWVNTQFTVKLPEYKINGFRKPIMVSGILREAFLKINK